jgi:hypothetical protein
MADVPDREQASSIFYELHYALTITVLYAFGKHRDSVLAICRVFEAFLIMDYSALVRSSIIRPDSFGGSGCHGHVPFCIWLVQSLAPKLVVELGTYNYSVYFNFCRAVNASGLRTTCYSVGGPNRGDFSGYVEADAFADAQRHNERLYSDISSLLCLPLHEAVSQFSDRSIDLLSIAGSHSYEAVKHEFTTWLPKLTDTAMVMVHHVSVRAPGYGVWRFWEELALRYPLRMEFIHSRGLGVIQLAEGADRFYIDWLSPESADKQLVRDYFSARGAEQKQGCDSSDARDPVPPCTQVFAERDRAVLEEATLRHELAKRNKAIAEIATLHHELTECDARIADLRNAAAERDAMAASLSWRITRPLRLVIGVLRGESAYRARLSELIDRKSSAVEQSTAVTGSSPVPSTDSDSTASAPGLLATAMPALAPFTTYPDVSPDPVGRLTLIIPSLGTGDLFSGVDTSILVGVLLARHRGLRLRVVTRDAVPDPLIFAALLAAHGVDYKDNVVFEYAPDRLDAPALADTGTELILTTSWSTTWAALRSFDPARIVYLVQDDERLFYPAGDLQLRCREVLCDTRLCFFVKSALLRDYLISGDMSGIANNSFAFDTAFSSVTYFREARSVGRKRRFLLYARRDCPQHLFLRGLEAVAGAIEENAFPATDWEFFVLGSDSPSIALPGGIKPTVLDVLPLHAVGALLRQIDVGLTLMYGPYLSDPVLGLAASGAVVVSNSFGPKQSLDGYCANIACVEPSLGSLVVALGQAAELAVDEPQRQANYESARINRDWESTVAPLLDALPR